MVRPLHPIEIFLQPGDCYFADRDTRIRTLLGSCVSMTFWHPRLLVGGMCHYMLPERGCERRSGDWPVPNGRFADEAVTLMLNRMDVAGAHHSEYQVKLFGGGDMFPETNKHRNETAPIGAQNMQAARRLTEEYGFSCVAEHLGGVGHRNVIFDVWSGEVWVKHANILHAEELKAFDRRLG
jgi:chemotaxis protein CheD